MELFKFWISEKGVTHRQLAEKLGVTPAVIGQYLARRTNPSLVTFQKLVDETGLPCKELLDMFIASPLQKQTRRGEKHV